MNTRFFRVALFVVLVLLAAQVLQPYVFRLMFAATSQRPVEPRGDLAEIEKATIELFRRASPSVVQVVGRVGNPTWLPRILKAACSPEPASSGMEPATLSPIITSSPA